MTSAGVGGRLLARQEPPPSDLNPRGGEGVLTLTRVPRRSSVLDVRRPENFFENFASLPYQAGLSILVGENGNWLREGDARCRLWRRFLPLYPQQRT